MKLNKPPTGIEPSLTRRKFLRLGTAGLACLTAPGASAAPASQSSNEVGMIGDLEYLTRDQDFRNVGRGKPPPHELAEERRRVVGLAQETWQLEVVPDPASDARVERPLSRALGTGLTWDALMKLAEKEAVRFLSVMSCTNMAGPLGMGLWEGVPLREAIWLARPTGNVRRVFYYGYHNDDPGQRFQSSLSLDRVLEDPPGELPVILCYKLNGQWLSPQRGAPVRLVVPGAYGNKSVKWLQHVVLTNNPRLNDTYADWNNDTESALKTCACFRRVPEVVQEAQPVQISGVAQVGMSGLGKVQYWLRPQASPLAPDDLYLTRGEWADARILPPPELWGGGLPGGKLPAVPLQFDRANRKPLSWPLRNTIVHWTARLPRLAAGSYDLYCRTIDAQGQAQPMPRPFPKSGYNTIQRVTLTVSQQKV